MFRRPLCLALACSLCLAAAPAVIAQAKREPVFVYAYQEGEDPNEHVKHTLMLVGEGDEGAARYTAASFSQGKRYSLAVSGSGSFSIDGEVLKIRAGKLEGTGVIRKGEFIQVGEQRFRYATRL
jgi:hypothetical protein